MFKDKFKELRKAKGLTQKQIAKELNVSKSIITMYETGQRNPSFAMLEAIADFFNVDMAVLLDKKTKISSIADDYHITEVMNMAMFAERLNRALEMRDMSAAELARRLKVNEGAISNYRKGTYVPKQKRLEQIADILKVSIPWLMGYDENPSPNNSAVFPEEQAQRLLFGKRVQQLRNDRLMSCEELAKRVGISRQALIDIENGVKPLPSEDRIISLALALGTLPARLTAPDAPGELLSAEPDDVVASPPAEPADIDVFPDDEELDSSLLADFAPAPISYRTLSGAASSGDPVTPKTDVWLIHMPDNSLVLDCIPKGAELTVRRNSDPEEGALTAVKVKGVLYVRRWHRDGDAVMLLPSNPRYTPVLTSLPELRSRASDGIIGVVDKVLFEP